MSDADKSCKKQRMYLKTLFWGGKKKTLELVSGVNAAVSSKTASGTGWGPRNCERKRQEREEKRQTIPSAAFICITHSIYVFLLH